MKRWRRGLTGLTGIWLMMSTGLEAGLEPGAPREAGYRDAEAVTERWFGEPGGVLRTPGSAEARWTAEWAVKGYLDDLAGRREGLEVRKVGESLLGAPVWGLFHEAVGVRGEALTVLIQARVHGNEPASTEGLLELAWELADGELQDAPVNVILIPVLNPEGAREMARRTGTDIDGNRDYVLQNSAIVRTVYRLMKAYDPEVVVDMHEHGSLSWPYDLMAIEPNNPNIPEALRTLTAERIIGAMGKAFEKAGLRLGPYRLVDRRDDGIRVRESATTFVSEKNAIALGGRINLLTEGRGIGLGTQHFKRRTVSQYTAARAVLEAAVRHRAEIRREVAGAREEIARGAEEWILRVEPKQVPARHAFLDGERLELVEHATTFWDRSNGTVTASVAVPRAYVVDAGETALLDRLEGFGLEMEILTESRELEVEKLVVSAFGPGDGGLYGGRLVRPDGALVRPTVVRNHDITVRAVKKMVRLPAGSRIIPTGQPMGLYLITLEPAAYSSFAALSFWGESLPEGFVFPVYRLR